MDVELLRGRKIVVAIIITTIAMSLFTVILTNIISGTGKIPQQAVSLILTLVLSYFLFKGVNAARIISIILYYIAAIFGAMMSIAISFKDPSGLVLLIPAIIYALCAILLMFSAPVKQYFSERRLKVENPSATSEMSEM